MNEARPDLHGARGDGAPPAQIFLRPIGSPLTVAMSGLAIASFVQTGLDLGWIVKGQALFVGLILVAVPFVLQLLACVLAYLARDGAAGAALGVLSTTWLAIGLVHIVSGTAGTSGALGLLLLVSGGLLALTAASMASTKPLVALVVGLAAARFGCAGVHELSTVTFWQDLGGIIGLVVTAAAGYCVLAFELEGAEHHPVLPTMRRGRARDAVSGPPELQVDGVVDEPGVRQTI